MTIVYVAETRGEAYPCASCGGKIGGLARRAGLVARLREQADRTASPLLLLLGPGEFAADRPTASASARDRRAEEWRLTENAPLSAAKSLTLCAALDPQAVYLSPEAGRWFRESLMKIPASFVPVGGVDGRAESRILDLDGRKVGLIFFAAAATGKDTAAKQAREGALFAGRALAGRVHLLIGISPWGFEAEKDFLPEAAGLFHILLGGGIGPGFAEASGAYSGRLLWSRPAAAGAGLNVISLYRWPTAAPPHWEGPLTHEARQDILGPGIAEDPATARLLGAPD